MHLRCWFARKMSQFTRFCGVKFLAWKSGCVKFLTNSMSAWQQQSSKRTNHIGIQTFPRRALPLPPSSYLSIHPLPVLQDLSMCKVASYKPATQLFWRLSAQIPKIFLSIFLIISVAIERYLAVCRPHHYREIQTDSSRWQFSPGNWIDVLIKGVIKIVGALSLSGACGTFFQVYLLRLLSTCRGTRVHQIVV